MSQLGDGDLEKILTVDARDYTVQALDIAREEYEKREHSRESLEEKRELLSAPAPKRASSWTRSFKGQAPSIAEARQHPVTTLVAALSILASVAWWAGVEMTWALPTGRGLVSDLPGLVASTFLHTGLLHLAFNLFWLWALGVRLESQLGRARFGGLVLLLGVVSAAAEHATLSSGVGLSGVVYGLFARAWVSGRQSDSLKEILDRRTIWIFCLWFLLCIGTTVAGVWAVGNVAHGSGAALGALVGWSATGRSRVRRALRVGLLGLFIVGVAVAAAVVPIVAPFLDDPTGYAGDLGYQALTQNKNEEAVTWLLASTAQEDAHPDAWHNLGVAYTRLGQHRKAVRAFREAWEMDREDTDRKQSLAGALFEAAQAELASGRADEASGLFEEAVRLNPSDEEAKRGLEEARARHRGGPTKGPATPSRADDAPLHDP
jgi:GlpG protein